jgi:hypothetical protein
MANQVRCPAALVVLGVNAGVNAVLKTAAKIDSGY